MSPSLAENPLVSVIMPVYNAAQYLQESIDSILNQSYKNIEFLIYNDGSTDQSASLVQANNDPRIIFYDSSTNQGYLVHLNRGLRQAKGKYIARMDADDVAHPERIARLVFYLEKNPDVGLCGSAVRYIGASQGDIYLPESNEVIQQTLWLQNAFYHPAVMLRTSVLRANNLSYNPAYEVAEDYKLWSEMSAFTKLHNLSEVLLDYRIHPHQISRRQSVKQQKIVATVRQEQMSRLNIQLAPTQQHAFELLVSEDSWRSFQRADYKQVLALLENLSTQAMQVGLSPNLIDPILSAQWNKILSAAKHYKPALIPFILNKLLYKNASFSTVAKLFVKSLIYWRTDN